MSRLRQTIARWTYRRQGADNGEFTLHRRRLYIIPTRLGLAYAVMLLAMLVGGLNYGNNLALLFTFLLAAAGWVAMHQAHANLQGLVGTLEGTALANVADSPIDFHLTFRVPSGQTRPDIEIDGPARPGLERPPIASVNAGQTVHLHWTHPPAPGLLRVRVATRYPLGLFRAWTWVHPAAPAVAAESTAETSTERSPSEETAADDGLPSVAGDGDIVGLRAWRPGDGWRRVAWRASARLGRTVVLERTWVASSQRARPSRRFREAPEPQTTTALELTALRPALLALGTASALLWGHVPWLVSAFLVTALLWRWLVAKRHWPLPPRWLKLLLALSAAGAVLLA
ncbi:MAG: hypothetical protein RJB26_422, partial [Pseudomonadota bacterium]